MKALIPFRIPVSGLQDGHHQYDFTVGRDFLAAFPDTPVEEGDLQVHLDFYKRPAMFVLEFTVEGTVRAACDRCLETIDLPVAGEHRILVKFSEEERAEEAEVIYVSPTLEEFNVAPYVYEFVVLSLPIVKVYECEEDENAPCNEEVLSYLEESENVEPGEETPNPIWDELKKKLNQHK